MTRRVCNEVGKLQSWLFELALSSNLVLTTKIKITGRNLKYSTLGKRKIVVLKESCLDSHLSITNCRLGDTSEEKSPIQ